MVMACALERDNLGGSASVTPLYEGCSVIVVISQFVIFVNNRHPWWYMWRVVAKLLLEWTPCFCMFISFLPFVAVVGSLNILSYALQKLNVDCWTGFCSGTCEWY